MSFYFIFCHEPNIYAIEATGDLGIKPGLMPRSPEIQCTIQIQTIGLVFAALWIIKVFNNVWLFFSSLFTLLFSLVRYKGPPGGLGRTGWTYKILLKYLGPLKILFWDNVCLYFRNSFVWLVSSRPDAVFQQFNSYINIMGITWQFSTKKKKKKFSLHYQNTSYNQKYKKTIDRIIFT